MTVKTLCVLGALGFAAALFATYGSVTHAEPGAAGHRAEPERLQGIAPSEDGTQSVVVTLEKPDADELSTLATCNPIETGLGWAQFYSGLTNCCQGLGPSNWHCVGPSSFCSPNDHTSGMNYTVTCHAISGGNDKTCATFVNNSTGSIGRMKCVCSTSTGATNCSFVNPGCNCN